MNSLLAAAALGALALAGASPALAQDPAVTPPVPRADAPPRDLLAAADTDHDGVVTREEAAAAADRRFAAMDSNGDGTIDRDERRAARPHRPGPRGDMSPPRNAAPSSLPGDAPAPPPRGHERDRDGRDDAAHRHHPREPREITRAQFRERAVRLFDRADANHDGRVDQQERAAVQLLMRARRIGPDGDLRDGRRGPPPERD
ncbi:hypothetical protein ACMGDM_01390 [Sphingomonas sp. DT-51]|uniref:hypothetical protein n=1 Tax=Sphingomonas sp. DT-51 TaxID=3396165 RepID=UPI003F1E18AE